MGCTQTHTAMTFGTKLRENRATRVRTVVYLIGFNVAPLVSHHTTNVYTTGKLDGCVRTKTTAEIGISQVLTSVKRNRSQQMVDESFGSVWKLFTIVGEQERTVRKLCDYVRAIVDKITKFFLLRTMLMITIIGIYVSPLSMTIVLVKKQ